MTSDDVLAEFRSAGALLEGHFVLSSGLHSAVFLQKMAIFTDPVRTARVCGALAERIKERYGRVDYVVSPAIGGIVRATRPPGRSAPRRSSSSAIPASRSPCAAASRSRRAPAR